MRPRLASIPRSTTRQVDGTTMDETGMLQLLVGWREQAWRNAELLVNAPTPAARAIVEAEIERVAAIESQLIVVATSYSSLNVQAALADLATIGAAPADTLPRSARSHGEPAPRHLRQPLLEPRHRSRELLRITRLAGREGELRGNAPRAPFSCEGAACRP